MSHKEQETVMVHVMVKHTCAAATLKKIPNSMNIET